MIFYPAIDIRGGKCVRLSQGDFRRETVYGDDPVEMARKWESEGARWVHVVDLDGARDGEPRNRDLIRKLASLVRIPVQLGGGVRDERIAGAYLDAGVRRVILGSVLVKEPGTARAVLEKFHGRVGLGVDAKDGFVAIDGWKTVTQERAVDLIRSYAPLKPEVVVYTDIGRDGMMAGPNLEETRRVARDGGVPVILSGGVSSVADIRAARTLEADGVAGVISGRALYDGSLQVAQALDALR